jgi:hypothetical protein
MTTKVKLACEPRVVMIEIDNLLPLRTFSKDYKTCPKYLQIMASVRELGIIEPLAVYPKAGTNDQYLLLDGLIRREVLKDLGERVAPCLISTDDEAFTYNHKVNRLTTIQEHFMVLKAIKSGISEERIAKTLNINVAAIVQKRDLLMGICPESVALLKERAISAGAIREMKKVKPMRQIEMAELMCSSNNFSIAYARCILGATPDDQLLDASQPKAVPGLSSDDMARMEHEMESVSRDFQLIEESHGRNVLNLVVVAGYLKRLIGNTRIARYLSQTCPEILDEFRKIAEAKRLEDEVRA